MYAPTFAARLRNMAVEALEEAADRAIGAVALLLRDPKPCTVDEAVTIQRALDRLTSAVVKVRKFQNVSAGMDRFGKKWTDAETEALVAAFDNDEDVVVTGRSVTGCRYKLEQLLRAELPAKYANVGEQAAGHKRTIDDVVRATGSLHYNRKRHAEGA